MERENWPRVKEIFVAALALPPDARGKYVAEAAGSNDVVRRHVEALLESHERATSFLDTPAHVDEASMAMPTLEGRRIGPYQLYTRIGAGGMGEVYEAHDTRLDRTVAIKVLPAHVAATPLARERFEREARAVAALNHPHICTLHDIGTHDGIDYLVMERLEGETLAARLERGSLPVKDALRYAIHILSALDRVHRAGIVHRDLKPRNIMLTKSGAKLLDFGVAKALPAAGSREITSPGMVIGTIEYMAPEQLEGKPADARSDLYAFGAVLYEMLTGRKASRDPGAAMPTVSLALDRTVRTCLAPDPDDRWQTARDLLRELTWIAEGSGDTSSALSPARRRSRTIAWITAAAAAIVTAVVGVLWYASASRGSLEAIPARFDVATPTTSDPMSFALSPDGRLLAFVADANGTSQLWLRPLDQVTPQPLANTEGASFPFWSPDGRAIAFFADGKLKRVDLGGGPAQVLADAPTGRGGAWNRDGIILFAPTTASTLMRVAAAGGTATPVTRFAAGQNSHRWPHFLPDGRRFLFLSTQGRRGADGVFIGALDGDAVSRVLDDDAPAVYVAPGALLVGRRGTLVALSFDADRGVVTGEPISIVQPIGFDSLLVRAAMAVSENGVLAHRTAIAERRQLEWVDRAGTTLGLLGSADDHAMAGPELARDGRRVAVFRTRDGNTDVWLMDVSGAIASRFTFHPTVDAFPVWSSDAQHVAFISNRNGDYGIFQRPANGSSDEQPLVLQAALNVPMPLDFSADGRFLLYAVKGITTGIDLWAQSLRETVARIPVAQTAFDEMAGQFSPDGRWVAYQSNSSGRMEVYVSPFPGPGGRQQVSVAGGSQVRWRPEGGELFYVAPDGRLMAVTISAGADRETVEASTPTPLFPARLATGANIPPAVGSKQQYDAAEKGRFLLNVSVAGAPAPPITVTLNWQAALEKNIAQR